MPTIRAVHAFHCGLFRAPGLLFTRGGGLATEFVPVLCFGLEADEGWVLVDGGFGSAGVSGLGRVRSFAFGRLGRLAFRPSWGAAARLRALRGEKPLLAAVVTHLDIDHAGGLREAAPPRVFLSAEEWEEAKAPAWLEARVGRYQPLDYLDLPMRPVDTTAREARDISPLFAAADLFGDGSVRLVLLAGHSAGHAGVLVRLADGSRVLLCGDAAFSADVVTGAAQPGLFPRAVAYDRTRMFETLERLRSFARLHPDVPVVPSHDPLVGARAADGPAVIARAKAPGAPAAAPGPQPPAPSPAPGPLPLPLARSPIAPPPVPAAAPAPATTGSGRLATPSDEAPEPT